MIVGFAAFSSGSGLQKHVDFVQSGRSPQAPSLHMSPPEQSLSEEHAFLQSAPRLQQNHAPFAHFCVFPTAERHDCILHDSRVPGLRSPFAHDVASVY